MVERGYRGKFRLSRVMCYATGFLHPWYTKSRRYELPWHAFSSLPLFCLLFPLCLIASPPPHRLFPLIDRSSSAIPLALSLISLHLPIYLSISLANDSTLALKCPENATISKTRKRCDLKSHPKNRSDLSFLKTGQTGHLRLVFAVSNARNHCDLESAISKGSHFRFQSATFLRVSCKTLR